MYVKHHVQFVIGCGAILNQILVLFYAVSHSYKGHCNISHQHVAIHFTA